MSFTLLALLSLLLQAREKFLGKVNVKMSIWEAVELLETLVDDSDPDT